MGSVRAFFGKHHQQALMLVVLALAMKALMPVGYMVGQQAKVLTIQICADAQSAQLTKQIVISHSGESDKTSGEHGKTGGACPFASLSMASLSGADLALLGTALLYILALGFAPVSRPRLENPFHLRPPLRGPPARV